MTDSAGDPGQPHQADAAPPEAAPAGGMPSGGLTPGPDAFVVAWNPVPTASRVAALSRSVRMSLIWGLIFPVILFVIWLATGRDNQTLLSIALVSLLITAVLTTIRVLRLRSARRALASVPRGTAMAVDRVGITVTPLAGPATHTVDWSQIIAVRAAGKSTGVGPDLVVSYTGGEWRAPLSFLDALPGTIDSALRAYSGARIGLDLSGLDSIW